MTRKMIERIERICRPTSNGWALLAQNLRNEVLLRQLAANLKGSA
jgi:hypothetical protein